MQDAPAMTGTGPDDWIAAALDILIEEGAAAVKVQTLARRLECSRSSFYWFFTDRADLLERLLAHWRDHSTGRIVERARRPAARISQGVLNIFDCWANPALFDPRLDFAIREWARRDARVKAAVDAADAERLAAISALFARFPGDSVSAEVRARTLYYMQIGYYALGIRESLTRRMALLRDYVVSFCGEEPDPADLVAFAVRNPADSARSLVWTQLSTAASVTETAGGGRPRMVPAGEDGGLDGGCG